MRHIRSRDGAFPAGRKGEFFVLYAPQPNTVKETIPRTTQN